VEKERIDGTIKILIGEDWFHGEWTPHYLEFPWIQFD
jgi:hypothetical protein